MHANSSTATMAEMPNIITRIHPRAIQLPSRPSTPGCLTWSAEHLVSAGGEVVHIIDTTSDEWRFEALRVNQFHAGEIFTDVAAGADFSIGREQSVSKVVAVAFSAHGLGIHSRAVLAVLTSSHVLSFWEHSGKPESWVRTCVVNNALALIEPTLKSSHIRAFAWLPPLRLGSGAHFLSFIDGNETLWTVQVCKTDRTSKAFWKFENLHGQPVSLDSEIMQGRILRTSLLQNVYSFDDIQPQEWTTIFDDQGKPTMSRIRLIFRKQGFRPDHRGYLSAIISVELEDGKYVLTSRMAGFAPAPANELSPQDFVEAIAEPAQHFDKELNLHGHYAIWWMGFALSKDRSAMAACVILRPSVGPSYTQPRAEHSTLLMAPTGEDRPMTSPRPVPSDVQMDILQRLAEIADMNTIATDTDVKIIRVAISMVAQFFPSHTGLGAWSTSAAELVTLFESEQSAYDESVPVEACETCRITGKSVALELTEGGSRGKCATGHEFTRCGITFLAIQEPGISKFCCQCSREFLCIEQLEPDEGPSVARTLLEECGHGLCPYCQGYFRD